MITREDAKVDLAQCKALISNAKNGMTDIELQLMLNRHIDKIYNDIDSRICKNCKYHKYIEKSFRKCDVLEINTSNGFGCNLFERKGKG